MTPVTNGEFSVAWYSIGMQMRDISVPFDMKVVAQFTLGVPEGSKQNLRNDVCSDDRGLNYLVGRTQGPHIVERN